MSIDISTLIEQVMLRPPLWDRQHSGYFNKRLVTNLWTEIAALQGVNPSLAKSKWKGLRDTFRLELRKYPSGSSWAFYKQMMFLRSHIKTRPFGVQEEDGESVKQEPLTEESPNCVFLAEFEEQDPEPSASYSDNLYQPSGTNRIREDSADGDQDRDDDDYHFLMSFLPEMKKLETKKKMLLRIKMMELFYKETYDPTYKD